MLLQLEVPTDEVPQLLFPWPEKPPDEASDALPVPVLELPGGGRFLLRNDTSCSKWSEASDTQWLPALELPLGAWSDGGGSADASSPEALSGDSAPQSPAAGQGQDEPAVAFTEGSEPLQSQPALERQPAAQDSSQHQLQSSESAPAALQGRGSGRRPPLALGARLDSMPAAGLQPAPSSRRFVPAEGRRLSGAEAQDPPQASVQLRKSGQPLRRQGSQEVLRLLAHAYSELVGGMGWHGVARLVITPALRCRLDTEPYI